MVNSSLSLQDDTKTHIWANLSLPIFSFKHFDQYLTSQLKHINACSGRTTNPPPHPNSFFKASFIFIFLGNITFQNLCILLILVLERKWNLSRCHTSFPSQYSVPSVCQVQKKSILWKIAKEVMIFVLNSLFCLSIKKANVPQMMYYCLGTTLVTQCISKTMFHSRETVVYCPYGSDENIMFYSL